MPVTGRKTWSTLGSSYKAKYSYVGVAAARGVVGKLYEASLLLPFPRASWPGNINEGLNSAGLGVSLQWCAAVLTVGMRCAVITGHHWSAHV